MGIREDILFGEIALNLNAISSEQLNECVEIQEKSSYPQQLGAILVEKGYLTPEKLASILEEQQKNLLKYNDSTPNKQKSFLFGQMVFTRGFASKPQINECIREQAKNEKLGIFMPLGEILVKKGYMKATEIQEILEQQRQIMNALEEE
jgi:mannitol/fructose-specific phosphotransferase system IIA component